MIWAGAALFLVVLVALGRVWHRHEWALVGMCVTGGGVEKCSTCGTVRYTRSDGRSQLFTPAEWLQVGMVPVGDRPPAPDVIVVDE